MFAAMHVKVTLVEGRDRASAVPRPRDGRAACAARCSASASTSVSSASVEKVSASTGAASWTARSKSGARASRATSCSWRPAGNGGPRARARGRRRRHRQARLRAGRRRLPDGGAEHLRRGRRHRLPCARVDVDGAGARRGVSRLRLHVQEAGLPPPAVRHLHDPRGELRRALRGAGRRQKNRRTSSAARSTATTRAARSSATRTASSSSCSTEASRKLLGCHCIGDRASELVHIGQAVITLGGTVETLIEMVFNYPTLAEMFKYAAYDALGHW